MSAEAAAPLSRRFDELLEDDVSVRAHRYTFGGLRNGPLRIGDDELYAPRDQRPVLTVRSGHGTG